MGKPCIAGFHALLLSPKRIPSNSMCHANRNGSNIIIPIILILVALVRPLPALSAAISLEYTIGFNDQFQLNTWTPVTVFIENKGRSINGTLEVLVTSGSEYDQDVYQANYALDVELPNNSKKSYALTVLIKSFTHEMIIRLKQNDNIIVSNSVYLKPYFVEKSFAVVADNFPSPDILSRLPTRLFPVAMPPKFLPETHYGYDSVKLLIMNAATISKLRDRQYQALTQWIKQGGYLITVAGLSYGSLVENRFRQMLPIEVRGHKRFFELNSLAQFCGRKLVSKEPFLVLNARIEDSHVLAHENDIPIISQKNVGLGQIVFLAFDFNAPPLRRWDGEMIFWDKILSLQSSVRNPMMDLDNQKILDAMFANLPAGFPDFKTGGLFIVIYLVILKYFQIKIRKPGKQRLKNSCYLLVIIVSFTALSYRFFFYPNNKQNFTYNSFFQLDLNGRNSFASGKYIVGLYSLKKSIYHLSLGPLPQPVTHMLSKHSKIKIPNPYVLHESDSGQWILGSLDNWSNNFYMMDSKLDSPLLGHALRDDHHLTLTVENKLPFGLLDCMVYFKKRFIFIDDILANNRQIIKLRLSDLKKTEIFNDHEADRIIKRFDSNGSPSFLKSMQSNLSKEVLFQVHDQYQSRPDSLFLIGWGRGGVIQPTFKQTNPAGYSLTMVNWEIPVEINS